MVWLTRARQGCVDEYVPRNTATRGLLGPSQHRQERTSQPVADEQQRNGRSPFVELLCTARDPRVAVWRRVGNMRDKDLLSSAFQFARGSVPTRGVVDG